MSTLRPYISEALISEKFGYTEERIETEKGYENILILEGEFQRANYPNRNNRIYETAILEREIGVQQQMISARGGNPMGMDHPIPNPKDPPEIQTHIIQRIGLENACALNIHLEMHNGVVYGKARVLTGDYGTGDKLAAFVRNKFKPAVSSRGMGGDPIPKNGYLYVPENYKMICFDFVTNPSTHNAILEQAIQEEYNIMINANKYTRKLWEVLIDFHNKY